MDAIEIAKEMMETAAEVDSIAAMQAFATMALAQAAIAQVEATREQTAELGRIANMIGLYLNQETYYDDPGLDADDRSHEDLPLPY